ncbi:MAG: GNAT family N-acetyltransferase [Actinomycetota bacterium]
MPDLHVVLSEDPEDFVRRDWSDLVARDPAGTVFHTPAFLKLYWEEFGRDPAHLLLAFGECDGRQVGAAAFERVDGVLRFLGGTEVTDYMGPVAEPHDAAAFATALVGALARRDDWERADLRGLPEDRAWLGLLADAAGGAGLRAEVLDEPNGVAPFLPLPATWDAYLTALPAKLRHEIRRKERRLEAEAGAMEVVVATRETLTDLLDSFVALHRTSEGPKGVFMQPGMEIFFRRLGEVFVDAGILQLAVLEASGRRMAGTFAFRFRGTTYLYNSAFDRSLEHWSPGMVLVGEDIRLAIEAGCAGFDLLKGDYAYKYRFGATARAVRRIGIER